MGQVWRLRSGDQVGGGGRRRDDALCLGSGWSEGTVGEVCARVSGWGVKVIAWRGFQGVVGGAPEGRRAKVWSDPWDVSVGGRKGLLEERKRKI